MRIVSVEVEGEQRNDEAAIVNFVLHIRLQSMMSIRLSNVQSPGPFSRKEMSAPA
jgi:hypothetical protein